MKASVMTFNLKYDFTNEKENLWGERVKRIVQVINDNEPIIVATQEGLIHMLKDMDRLLENYNRIGQGRLGKEKDEFNAIFYRKDQFDLVNWGQFWLSKTPKIKCSKDWNSSLPRICTWAHIKSKSISNDFIIYNTHLDHESQEAREKGIEIILSFIRDMYRSNKIPFIIMGDFNCTYDNEVFNIIRSFKDNNFIINNCYDKVNHDITCTFHDFKGGQLGEVIDYILLSKEFTVFDVKVDLRKIDGGYPSDHYAVVAKIEYL